MLRPIGYEYWTLGISSPTSTKPFAWVWIKYRVVDHKETGNLQRAFGVGEVIQPLEYVEVQPKRPMSYNVQMRLWKAIGYLE